MIELISPSAIQTNLPVPGYETINNLKNHPKRLSINNLNWIESLINDDRLIVDEMISFNLGQGYENTRDFTKAIKWYSKSAELGSIDALNYLGDLYLDVDGLRGEKDYNKAAECFSKGAEQGDARSQDELACCYRKGWGVEQNDSKAFEWFTKAANQGFTEAMYFLALSYYEGRGTKVDYAESVRWMKNAAERGKTEAQLWIGIFYNKGIGLNQDCAKAVEWFTKAAEKGDATAQTELGLSYFYGTGVVKDPSMAAKWLSKAANQGFAKAQSNLGLFYYAGVGVEKSIKQAVYWYSKAADQGYALAQRELGICYYNGHGIEKNQNIGIDWILKAAKQGDAKAFRSLAKAAEVEKPVGAITKLGLCYQNGYAVEIDYKKAIELYKRAIELGDHTAEKCLGECYFYGYGVRKDISTAKKWFLKADALLEFEKLIERETKRQERGNNNPNLGQKSDDSSQQGASSTSFNMFCKEFINNRAECKTFAIFGKGKRFEILTTPLTFNIYNTFKSRSICTEDKGEYLMDQYKNKNEINDLIDILIEIFRDNSLTFRLPSIKQSAAAQGAKVIDKKGVYLVVEFPDFEE